jgi:hypothetical protein
MKPAAELLTIHAFSVYRHVMAGSSTCTFTGMPMTLPTGISILLAGSSSATAWPCGSCGCGWYDCCCG